MFQKSFFIRKRFLKLTYVNRVKRMHIYEYVFVFSCHLSEITMFEWKEIDLLLQKQDMLFNSWFSRPHPS